MTSDFSQDTKHPEPDEWREGMPEKNVFRDSISNRSSRQEHGRAIILEGQAATRFVWLDGKRLFPGRSLRHRSHSPTGFNWGYGGSGPAQLALAVLLECTDEETAGRLYQEFKWEWISHIPGGMDFDWEIPVEAWIAGKTQAP